MGQLGRSLAATYKFYNYINFFNYFSYLYGAETVLLTDICKRPVDFSNTSIFLIKIL